MCTGTQKDGCHVHNPKSLLLRWFRTPSLAHHNVVRHPVSALWQVTTPPNGNATSPRSPPLIKSKGRSPFLLGFLRTLKGTEERDRMRKRRRRIYSKELVWRLLVLSLP